MSNKATRTKVCGVYHSEQEYEILRRKIMTIFDGIDVSKRKNDLTILNENGEILSKNFQFANTYQEF